MIANSTDGGALMVDGFTVFGWVLFAGVAFWCVPALLWFLIRELKTGTKDRLKTVSDVHVSVIVPACNEEANIRQALESLLRTTGVSFRIIAVNDRSTDATGALMDAVAATDSRCTVIHVKDLPEGWLGKNHAMHVGAMKAAEKDGTMGGTSESDRRFLLFTDGDVVFEPLAIATAAENMKTEALQHLCLMPKMLPGSAIENSVVAFFGLTLAIGQQIHLMPTRWPFSYAGVGAFNMLRESIYQKIGGHQKIAMDVLDDIKIGKLVRQHGGKQDFLAAPQLLSLRWYDSLWSVITGLEKNGFAALSYSCVRLFLVTVIFLMTMIAPYCVVLAFPWPVSAGYWATLILWQTMFTCVVIRLCIGSGGSLLSVVCASALFPVAAILMAFAFYRSAWKTIAHGGVRWRTTFYPLQRLKENLYQ